MVVVTSLEDRETQRVCQFYHVECVLTDVLGAILQGSIVTFFLQFGKLDYFLALFSRSGFGGYHQLVFRGKK